MQRLFEIVYLLMERGGMTADKLAAHFEVSTRTIRRDVDALSAAGIPIYAARGRGGGVRLLPDFVLNKTMLTATEQDEILFALQSLQAMGVAETKNILSRLSGLFRRSQMDWINVDFSCWGSDAQEKKKYQLLKKSILAHMILKFEYYGINGERSARTVEPYHLDFKGGSWYLRAWCRERHDYRTFKITRIEHLQLSEEHFTARAEPMPEMDDPNSALLMQHLTLRFSPCMAFRVLDEFFKDSITKQADGSYIVELNWPINDWHCGYLLSFGSAVEVLSPPEVRERLREECEKIFSIYHK